MPNYRRRLVPGGTYFFTVAVVDRRTAILSERIDALSHAFRVVRAWRPFAMPACVVLPDHPHCLWSLPEGGADFPARWNRIKGEFSRSIDDRGYGSPSRTSRRERAIWQRRYWAQRPGEWRYSSFHRFVRQGVLPADWVGSARVEPRTAAPPSPQRRAKTA
ncbi:REP-associated tyrosine transposase [Lysobacter hankyongensis]|uniref:REP-associated tyrosine transposase n=1 Tax=Lysobacter hankyongensis TaxID=1176535 RepID=UPI0031F0EBCF